MRACLFCGTTFEIPTDRRIRKVYCSIKCSSSAANLRYTARHPKQCPGCDSLSVRYNVTYCTPSCKQRHINRHKALVLVPADQVRPIVKAQVETVSTRTFYAGTCNHCGDAFISTWSLNDYCSIRCARQSASQRRRALRRGAYVEPVYRHKVFIRDNYVCQLCMKPCLTDVSVQHMQAPTIDHIIALANGGEHSMSNVQTAHRICNCRKSNQLVYSAA